MSIVGFLVPFSDLLLCAQKGNKVLDFTIKKKEYTAAQLNKALRTTCSVQHTTYLGSYSGLGRAFPMLLMLSLLSQWLIPKCTSFKPAFCEYTHIHTQWLSCC